MHTKLCILIEISVRIRMTKKMTAIHWSCVTNCEFHLRNYFLKSRPKTAILFIMYIFSFISPMSFLIDSKTNPIQGESKHTHQTSLSFQLKVLYKSRLLGKKTISRYCP